MQDKKGLIICSCCTPHLSHCLLFRLSQTPTAHTLFLVVSPGRPAPSAQSRLEELSADDRWQQQGLCSGKRKTKLERLSGTGEQPPHQGAGLLCGSVAAMETEEPHQPTSLEVGEQACQS